MIIYHGNPNPSDIEACRDAAPSYDHRAEYDIESFRLNTGIPYILDNGAFNCYKKNKPWDATLFVRRLNQAKDKDPDPDFVILPDVVTDPRGTYRRAREWAPWIDYPTLYPCQDGVSPERACDIAEELDAGGIFVGGTVEWKRENAERFVETSHDNDLWCHIGRPGDLVWAEDIGADSVDTSSIVRNQAWERLSRIELAPGSQTPVDAFAPD